VIGADGQNDVPYSQQRVDEILLREQDIAARRHEHLIRLGQLDRLITVEQDRIDRLTTAQIAAPRDGIIWRNHVANGGEVQPGATIAELLDCGDLFLDVTVDERKYEAIRPGDTTEVLLIGAAKSITGTVRSVRGSGAVTDDQYLAAKVPARAAKEFQVIVDLDRNALDLSDGTYCQVGRAAKVTISKGRVEPGWRRQLDAWIDQATDRLRDLLG
jgi:multidrug resistance efflux pump